MLARRDLVTHDCWPSSSFPTFSKDALQRRRKNWSFQGKEAAGRQVGAGGASQLIPGAPAWRKAKQLQSEWRTEDHISGSWQWLEMVADRLLLQSLVWSFWRCFFSRLFASKKEAEKAS